MTMTYDQWKTRSPDDERHDEPDDDLPTELEAAYDMLEHKDRQLTKMRRALNEALIGLRNIRDTDPPSDIAYPDQWRRGMADGVLMYVEATLGSRKCP